MNDKTTTPEPVTQADLDKLAYDLTTQVGEAIAKRDERITALELSQSGASDLDKLAAAVQEQHGISLVLALKDLLRTRGLDVTLSNVPPEPPAA